MTDQKRREFFELFARAVRLFVSLGKTKDETFIRKLDMLITYKWVAQLEFSFDSAGPLLGSMTMVTPGSPPLEVLRMDQTGKATPFSLTKEQNSKTLFSFAANVARELIIISSTAPRALFKMIDEDLTHGSILTLQFVVDHAGPKSCSVLLQDYEGNLTEISRLVANQGEQPFYFATGE